MGGLQMAEMTKIPKNPDQSLTPYHLEQAIWSFVMASKLEKLTPNNYNDIKKKEDEAKGGESDEEKEGDKGNGKRGLKRAKEVEENSDESSHESPNKKRRQDDD